MHWMVTQQRFFTSLLFVLAASVAPTKSSSSYSVELGVHSIPNCACSGELSLTCGQPSCTSLECSNCTSPGCLECWGHDLCRSCSDGFVNPELGCNSCQYVDQNYSLYPMCIDCAVGFENWPNCTLSESTDAAIAPTTATANHLTTSMEAMSESSTSSSVDVSLPSIAESSSFDAISASSSSSSTTHVPITNLPTDTDATLTKGIVTTATVESSGIAQNSRGSSPLATWVVALFIAILFVIGLASVVLVSFFVHVWRRRRIDSGSGNDGGDVSIDELTIQSDSEA